ncbi:hypothetical protein MVES1_002341 [Malassezia vespertilionis]|uniref:NADH:ubiquinone oxidoreductase intermediate-associated protein 30 domain-containing protein n=1 Tax=Malassezia vespertilionis TaxID=2020962 RepID=A0A2N1JCC5_9BASI|nr:uncharacterized protein MVES1_002341 [Malassezia vespertilionis]PKI84187.1 hypothetical protein MVES_002208 [Malassezia vespertilionis]WFD06986.1 hypothetical protein MVES1_002341 [Malassezia vespertilionis]
MDVSTADLAKDVMPLYTMTNAKQIAEIATGSDADIGGLSRCHIAHDSDTTPDGKSVGYGRFYGTISAQIPRKSALERSGYAAFRNKSRPKLFGTEVWDTLYYPYIALRVRNKTPMPEQAHSSLRSALHADDQAGPTERAIAALGINVPGQHKYNNHGPLFFVNIKTDGPVTTDLYQHRLFLDNDTSWRTITLPLDAFVLTNTGVVADQQISMMRERILSVGISVLLTPPQLVGDPEELDGEDDDEISALRHDDPARGSKRDASFTFDLDVQGFWVVESPEKVHEISMQE